ncbi:Hypothetical predicted protein [Marmota monax]|uniref:Uncharacterized protein n=1 Tax=Marmota monax TaxID=9995 RepID=A0A5E4D0B1_MARMO|nr:Hypothetical predicted protein [Marmota monax]
MEVRRRPASSTHPRPSAAASRLPHTPPQTRSPSTPTSARAVASYELGDQDDDGTALQTTPDAKGRNSPRTRSYGVVTRRNLPGHPGELPESPPGPPLPLADGRPRSVLAAWAPWPCCRL